MQGIILKALSGFYYVGSRGSLYECRARGSFRKSGLSPLVGDGVDFSATDSSHGVIENIRPRKSELSRPAVANIDKLLIVSSYSTPSPDTLLIDRMSARAVFHGITPVVVFNKCDTGDFSAFEKIYRNAGFKTYVVSATENIGIEALKCEVANCICAFAGNSGVGKSSLLNAIFGESNIATGDVSDKLGRGRHTTRHTELYPHPLGGFIADTPGFSSLETTRDDLEFKTRLVECFPDIEKHTIGCRFSSCTHTKEDGCSVLSALNGGKIEPSRHQSYISLFNELKDLKPWEQSKHQNFKKR